MLEEVRQFFLKYSDRLRRDAQWQGSARYWLLRRRVNRARFEVARHGFRARHAGKESAQSLSVTVQVLRAVALPAGVSLVAMIALSAISPMAVEELRGLGFSPDPSGQNDLYSTTAQIAGVFLGLYFTALSLLASTSYREVPADLRRVVVEERVGSVYLKVVAFTGALALYCLGAQVVGFEPGVLNASLVTLLGALSVVSFVLLGLRVFTFFDPSSVGAYLTARIIDAATAATPRGYGWRDISFQSHQQALAQRAADSLRTLVKITAASPAGAHGLGETGRRVIVTLAAYSALKPDIPPMSHWFERITRHESWLTASSTSLETALRMGYGMLPRTEPDLLWIENHLTGSAILTLRLLIERREYREALTLIQTVLHAIDSLARTFQLDAAITLHEGLLGLLPLLTGKDDSSKPQTDTISDRTTTDLYRLAIIDSLVSAPITIIAAVGGAARNVRAETVTAIVAHRLASSAASPLKYPVPPATKRTLEFFGDALDFEREVEGLTITSEWFIAHNVARTFCIDLSQMLTRVTDLAETTYANLLRPGGKGQMYGTPDATVAIIQRGREAAQKLEYHSAAMADTVNRLGDFRRTFGEQGWSVIDTAETAKKSRALDKAMLRALAGVAPALSSARHTGELPDALGFALTTLANESFTTIVADDESLFAELFPAYLLLAMKAYDRARLDLSDREIDTQLLFTLDLLLEVAELSGYAYLNSYSRGGPYWETVRSAWDALLSSSTDPGRMLKLLVLGEDYRAGNLWVMTARDLIRTRWKQSFSHVMEEAGMMREQFHSSWDDDLSIRAVPVDPLTSIFFERNGLMDDARDVFYVSYVAKRPEAISMTLPDRARELVDRMARVLERRKEDAQSGIRPNGSRGRRAWFVPEPEEETLADDINRPSTELSEPETKSGKPDEGPGPKN